MLPSHSNATRDRNGRELRSGDKVMSWPERTPGRVTGFSAGRVEVSFNDGIARRPYGRELVKTVG